MQDFGNQRILPQVRQVRFVRCTGKLPKEIVQFLLRAAAADDLENAAVKRFVKLRGKFVGDIQNQTFRIVSRQAVVLYRVDQPEFVRVKRLRCIVDIDFKRTVKRIDQFDLLVPMIGRVDLALLDLNPRRKVVIIPNQLKLTVHTFPPVPFFKPYRITQGHRVNHYPY